MVPESLFSVIVWAFGPLIALGGAAMLLSWLWGEIRKGYYKAE